MSFKVEVVEEIPKTAVKVETVRRTQAKTESLFQQLLQVGKPLKLEFQKRSTIVSRLHKLASKKGYDLEVRREVSNPQVFYVQLGKAKKAK